MFNPKLLLLLGVVGFITVPTVQSSAQTPQIDSLSHAAAEVAANPQGWARAVSLYREALTLIDADAYPGEAGKIHIELGFLFYQAGEQDSLFSHAKKALALFLSPSAQTSRADIAEARIQIAHAHLTVTEADSAEKYFRDALPESEEEPEALGAIYNGLGRVFELVDSPDSALVYHRLAYETWRSGDIEAGFPVALHDIGMAYLQRGQSDSARIHYDSAVVLYRQQPDTTEMASTLAEIARLLAMTGHPDSAFSFYWRAHALDSLRQDRNSMADNLSNIGAAFQACMRPEPRFALCNRPDSALHYYHLGLQGARASRDPQGEASALTNIASLSRKTGDYGQAVAYADSAAAVWARMRVRAGADASRVSSAERFRGLFHVWALAWLARASEPGMDSASVAWGALAAAERGRAQALLDLMRDSVGQVPLGRDMVAEGRALARASTMGSAAVIEYVVTPDTVLTWLILPGGDVHLFRTPVSAAELSAVVDSLRLALGVPAACEALPSEAPQDYDRWLERLAILLFPRALQQRLPAAGDLVISPHSALNRIPFAALPLDGGDLLGLKYALRYTPSLAALLEAERRPEFPYTGSMSATDALVVGNPAMPSALACRRPYQLPGLPATGAFASELARSLGTNALTGASASERAVRERLPLSRFVFLGTHAYAYETPARAPNSFIALAPTDLSQPPTDGLLTVAEVLALPLLAADLIVLSACRTALGDRREGEGTVGLQRAFLARGARTVLVSQWDVSQEVTLELMGEFFRRVRADPDAGEAEALRQAQLVIRKRWPHPRLWAAFQVVGAR